MRLSGWIITVLIVLLLFCSFAHAEWVKVSDKNGGTWIEKVCKEKTVTIDVLKLEIQSVEKTLEDLEAVTNCRDVPVKYKKYCFSENKANEQAMKRNQNRLYKLLKIQRAIKNQ